MDVNLKSQIRREFKLKIHESNGQAFEDLFIQIMRYRYRNFQAVKAWGNIGDRKNDGYIRDKGIYFQVYAPENIKSNYPQVIKKLKDDFTGLIEEWSPVREFYFVVNDKYLGLNADSLQSMVEIQEKHSLENAGFITANDLEDILFELEEDEIYQIVRIHPDPMNIKTLNYSILNEVIAHIMEQPLENNFNEEISLPNWNHKISFNGLSTQVSTMLNNGYMKISALEEYLKRNSNFLAEELSYKVKSLYVLESKNAEGDKLFWNIVNKISPKNGMMYQISTIVIMAKYFETCDIFERPSESNGEYEDDITF